MVSIQLRTPLILYRLVLSTALLWAIAYHLLTAANEVSAQSSPPAMPTGLTTSITYDRVAISWDDPGGDSTMGYQVLRRPVDGDEYGDGRGAPGFVAVTDDPGSVSTTKSATVVLTGAVRTERPRTLIATATGGTVVLTWEMPQGWGYTNYYDILRSRPELGEVIPLKRSTRFTNGQTTYTDTDVEPGVLYVYQVRGADFFGTPRDASEPIEIRTPQEAPPHNSPATGAPPSQGPSRWDIPSSRTRRK